MNFSVVQAILPGAEIIMVEDWRCIISIELFYVLGVLNMTCGNMLIGMETF